jgi:hypothetical protein
MVFWILATLRSMAKSRPGTSESSATLLIPAVAGSLVAIIIADLFVQYPKFEVRFWFLTLGMLLMGMVAARSAAPESASPVLAHPSDTAPGRVGAEQA